MNTRNTFTLFLIFYLPILVFPQSKKTISGFITDVHSGESLIGASIFDTNLKKGITTNEFGFYSLTIETGNRNLQSSYVGYNTELKAFTLKNDTVINFQMASSIIFNEINIVGHYNHIFISNICF